MHKVRIAACALGAAGTVGIALGVALPADAAAPQYHVVKTLTTSVIAPLQFKVVGNQVYVADDSLGTLSIVGKGVIARTTNGDELAGVSVDPATGTYAYSTSNQGEQHFRSNLTIVHPDGSKVVADIYGYEKKNNPDGRNTYGVEGYASPTCRAQLAKAGIPADYKGQVDSHPYAVSMLSNGNWAVADAGANAILKVDRYGTVSTLAVLPPQPVKITKAFADGSGVPACAGVTYTFEPVPTDVEWGPGGLYTTTLPGGPPSMPGLANPGSVYQIQYDGTPVRVATGFNGAVNLAIAPDGSMFVAEIYSGTISQVYRSGYHQVVAHLPAVVSIEWANGTLYAGTSPAAASEGDGPPPSGPPPAGSVVVLGR